MGLQPKKEKKIEMLVKESRNKNLGDQIWDFFIFDFSVHYMLLDIVEFACS